MRASVFMPTFSIFRALLLNNFRITLVSVDSLTSNFCTHTRTLHIRRQNEDYTEHNCAWCDVSANHIDINCVHTHGTNTAAWTNTCSPKSKWAKILVTFIFTHCNYNHITHCTTKTMRNYNLFCKYISYYVYLKMKKM